MGTAPPPSPSTCPPPTGDLPARVLDDPPVVDVLEGVTGDLLLVRTSSSIFIPEDHKQALTSLKETLIGWLAAGCT